MTSEPPDPLPPDTDDPPRPETSDGHPSAYPQTLPDGRPFPVAGLATERRIAWTTLVVGVLAAGVSLLLHNSLWAVGLAIGAVLGWLNFRWLRRGLDALVGASLVQAGAARPHVPVSAYLAAAFRYALIALTAYVIFKYLKVPLVSMIAGMCALGIAAAAVSVYEVIRPAE